MKSSSIFRLAALTGLAACCLPSVARAQSRLPRIGADIGYSYLLDSKARAAFGSGVTEFGVGFGNITPTIDGRVSPDISILRPRQTTNGIQSDALVISVGPEYRKVYIPGSVRSKIDEAQQQQLPPDAFPPGTKMPQGIGGPPPVLPYYGASANLVYAQTDVPTQGVDDNGFGVGGSVFAGVTFNNRFFLEGRLRATTNVAGFNFSRAGVTAGVRF